MRCFYHLHVARFSWELQVITFMKPQPGTLQPTQMDGPLNNHYRSLYFPRDSRQEAGMVNVAPAVSGIVQFI